MRCCKIFHEFWGKLQSNEKLSHFPWRNGSYQGILTSELIDYSNFETHAVNIRIEPRVSIRHCRSIDLLSDSFGSDQSRNSGLGEPTDILTLFFSISL